MSSYISVKDTNGNIVSIDKDDHTNKAHFNPVFFAGFYIGDLIKHREAIQKIIERTTQQKED